METYIHLGAHPCALPYRNWPEAVRSLWVCVSCQLDESESNVWVKQASF